MPKLTSQELLERAKRDGVSSLTPAQLRQLKRLRETLSYERHRERASDRQRTQSRQGRDIGEIPAVESPQRRAIAEDDLWYFCESYFPDIFTKPFSDEHVRVIGNIQAIILGGGLQAVGLPRGFGKTTICEIAMLWAMLYGRHRLGLLIGPGQKHTERVVKDIVTALTVNPMLAADFPEVCYPFSFITKRGGKQSRPIYRERLLVMALKSDEVVLPDIDGSPSCGATIFVTSLTGQVRGAKTMIGTKSVRPSIVLVDDPQDRESAASPAQVHKREQIIEGDILKAGGPDQRMGVMLACTIIYPDDLSARFLDRKLRPQWRGIRVPFVKQWSNDEAVWREYVEVRRAAFTEFADYHDSPERVSAVCAEFYEARRARMDAGAVLAWPARFDPGELSALQHAWNRRADESDAAFFAEYQNNPLPQVVLPENALTPEYVAARVNGHGRGIVPAGVTRLTAFIDVQHKVLYWIVVGWEDDFTGYVLDYGTEPKQRSGTLALADVKYTLAMAKPGAGLEGAVYAGIERLAEQIVGREWKRDDGAAARIERCLVDSGEGLLQSTVDRACRQTTHSAVLAPSNGKGIGPDGAPMDRWKKRPGERVGFGWRFSSTTTRSVRRLIYDTNLWKSFIRERFNTAIGDPGALTLFGNDSRVHREFADHATAEYSVRTEGRGRTVDVWQEKRKGADNHLWDCLVGAAVAASMQGAALAGMNKPVTIVQYREREPARTAASSPGWRIGR